MVNESVKKWLINDEKKKIRRENRRYIAPLTVIQVLPVIGIIRQFEVLGKTLIHSRLQPDYMGFALRVTLFILLIAAAGEAKRLLMKKKCSHIRALEDKTDEDAYIEGNELVLTGKKKGEELNIRIPVSAVSSLKSENGRTSLTYMDSTGKTVQFTCLDYYSPQIAEMLTEQY